MFRFGEMHDLKSSGAIAKNPRLGRMNPARIIGGVYFVGTYQASSHIIDTGEGLIMIDTGYSNTAYLLVDSVYRLGYKPEDIKYIINTHWHFDHTEATADIAALSGAKTVIGREDFEKAKKYFTADILVDDGDTLTLGNTTVTFMHTPGHTKGTMSFFFDAEEDGKIYRVGSFGGAGANTLVPEKYDFENPREAYFKSLERLKKEKVDVFIGNHTWNNGTYEKSQIARDGEENPFIDGTLWEKFLDACESRLKAIIKKEEEGK